MLKHKLFHPIMARTIEDLEPYFGKEKITSHLDGRCTIRISGYNRNLEIHMPSGTCSKAVRSFRCGILFGDTAEFYLFDNPSSLMAFNVGAVEVTIERKGSDLLYFLVGSRRERRGNDFKECEVVKLKNVNEENVFEYLDKALFKMGIFQDYGTVWPTAGVENRVKYFSDLFNKFANSIEGKDFKYSMPINNFNGAMRSTNMHERFLYLYKIIEFFWKKALEEKLVEIRRGSLTDEEYSIAILRLSNSKEIVQLTNFLSLVITDDVKETLAQDLGYVLTSIPSLADEIYSFRNAIVHSKQEKMEKTEPAERFVGEFTNDTLLEIVEYLAIISIERWNVV